MNPPAIDGWHSIVTLISQVRTWYLQEGPEGPIARGSPWKPPSHCWWWLTQQDTTRENHWNVTSCCTHYQVG